METIEAFAFVAIEAVVSVAVLLNDMSHFCGDMSKARLTFSLPGQERTSVRRVLRLQEKRRAVRVPCKSPFADNHNKGKKKNPLVLFSRWQGGRGSFP